MTFPKPAKGTVTRTRRNTRRSKEARFRNAAWARHGYKDSFGRWVASCARCHMPVMRGLTAEVDHIEPRSTRPDLAFDVENSRITCVRCNRYLKDHPLERDL